MNNRGFIHPVKLMIKHLRRSWSIYLLCCLGFRTLRHLPLRKLCIISLGCIYRLRARGSSMVKVVMPLRLEARIVPPCAVTIS